MDCAKTPLSRPSRPIAGSLRRSFGGALAAALFLVSMGLSVPLWAAPVPLQSDDEIEALIAIERVEADLMRRRGNVRQALRRLGEHLEDEPSDAASRTLRALCRHDQGRHDEALEDGERALADAKKGDDRSLRAECARNLAQIHRTAGRYADALQVLESVIDDLAPGDNALDAWAYGMALWESGDREGARIVLQSGVDTDKEQPWQALVAKARCERHLGRIQRASRTLIDADKATSAVGSAEPDVLVTLGDLYFESEREVEASGKRSAAQLYKEALEHNATHEGALLGLFDLHRYNRRRTSRSPNSILADLLNAKPESIDGLLAGAAADLDDGQLKSARQRIAKLKKLAPARRELRTLQAALAWVEHRRDDCRKILDELAESTGGADSAPSREVGRHLLQLYRFSEALGFLQEATKVDPSDYQAWTHLGNALANTGDEDGARDALAKAKIAARGRQDAWRNNMTLVLERMKTHQRIEKHGELTFSWRADAADVLRAYMVPFYHEARTELAERYGHTPEPATIEVFRKHQEFSVRSVGFEGFPAYGVCFGPVVTAISPLCEMRGTFSWARTGFHEFSHVVHLGLSHNRCPRWITEGLATWEEVEKNPTWTRNMRRELIDSRANGDLIKVRDLNRAFRGPRIIFGYYQGGLLCSMLIDEHGFPPMIRLLEAFDRGLDLDQAFKEVFSTTPEEVDADFEKFVDGRIKDLVIEPRWNPAHARRLRVSLASRKPETAEEQRQWEDDWCTVAFSSWQQGRRVDAQEALRRVQASGANPLRAQVLRGEMALADKDTTGALRIWKAAEAAGSRDFRMLIGLAALYQSAGDVDQAIRLYEKAESVFPGYDDRNLSAEQRLVEIFTLEGETEKSNAALERWLAWNAGDLRGRRLIGAWHLEAERYAEAERMFAESNEIDPFLRSMHVDWGTCLRSLGRFEEAAREFSVARMVPPDLDADEPGPMSTEQEAELMAQEAECLLALGRLEASRALAEKALAKDPDNDRARALNK